MKTTGNQANARVLTSMVALALGGLALGAGCGDDSDGSGGAGGEAATSSGAQTSTSGSPTSSSGSPASTSPASTSGGQGGDGGGTGGTGEGGTGEGGTGEGGGTGGAGEGGGGGASGACLDTAEFSDLFALETDELCVVALYDAPDFLVQGYAAPTWGQHGGLLTGEFIAAGFNEPITAVEVTRWTAPDGATGELTAATEEIELGDLVGDDALFGGSQLLDIENGITAFAYTGTPFTEEGGLVFFDEAGALEVDLLLGGTSLGLDPSTGLPIYSAIAPALETEAGSSGLFGSEACGEDGYVCGGFAYELWGDNSGPVAVDADGNVFAVMTSNDGTQAAHGFSAEEIAAGGETSGAVAFEVDGFGLPLAAIAPTADADGLLVFQATELVFEGKNVLYVPQEPIFVTYAAADGEIDVTAEAAPLLTLATPETDVNVVADDGGRIWVGVATDGGARFAVLARP